MKQMIIADTDFLSAFFKINRVDLIFAVFPTEKIIITGAVSHELEKAPFYDRFLELLSTEKRINIRKSESMDFSQELGVGELESMQLAERTNSILLMNDQEAVRIAEKRGIKVLDIPTFLLLCKKKNIAPKEEIMKIIKDLKEKDHYQFSEETTKKLLE